MKKDPPRGWHNRGYLPHYDGGPIPQFLTFRLADALPANVLERWKLELESAPRAELRRRIELIWTKATALVR